MLRILKGILFLKIFPSPNRKGNDKSHEILRKLVKYILKDLYNIMATYISYEFKSMWLKEAADRTHVFQGGHT